MKNEYKLQKTNISVTKRVFSVLVAIVVIATSVISAYAINSNPSYTFYSDNQPLSSDSLGTLVCTYGSEIRYQNIGNTDIYFAGFWVNNTNFHVYVLSKESGGAYKYLINNRTYSIDNYNSQYEFYWKESNNLANGTLNTAYMPIYDSADELFQEFNSFLNNPNPPTGGNELNISLPAGNVAIIEMGTGSNPVTLTTTTADAYPTPNNNINGKAILQTDTLPSVVSSSIQGASYITWSGTGGTTINGWYYTWKNNFDQVFDYHKYMIVINPLYGISSSGTIANSRIDINVTKAVSYQIVPLDTAITSEGLVGNDSGVVYDGTYDPDSGEWSLVDEEGNPVEPTVGGGNIVQGTANTIHDFLQNIANEISGFFTGAIGAVNTLVNAVSNFAGTLKALYIWLPAPVYSVLTAAIILAITIGVIKVFI